MVLIKDLGNGDYQTFPITDDMIEVEDPEEWSRARKPQPSQEDIARREAIDKIIDCQLKLGQTDYIVSKLAEAQLLAPATVESLIEKYREILNNRAEWRAEINRLEELIRK